MDSDEIVRTQVYKDPAVVAAVRQRFGPEVVGADGGIDRAALGPRVFGDDEARRWLEELIHPGVFAVWREAFAAEPGARWAVEVPLLFEKSLENWFDFIGCVACSPAQQLARLEQRGLSHALAGQRISTQQPLARKIELADFVLWNDGSADFLEAQVATLAASLAATR